MSYLSMPSPLGDLTLFEEDGRLVALDWGRVDGQRPTPVLEQAVRQLEAYFDGELQRFDLPLAPAGSDFQRRVWQAMADIPYGRTETYGALAARVGSAPRAIGMACGRNPLPILLPCHRVLAANRRLGGYSGLDGPETKKFLLALEGCPDL